MKTLKYFLVPVLMMLFSACDKKNEGVVSPLVEENFPQILLLADEGDGELEDEDKFSFKITLANKLVPLTANVTVDFQISKFEGFNSLPAFISGAKAFYEIDDCKTSEDENIDLNLVYDQNTGKGSVTFPKGVEEIEIEFETDEDLLNDAIFNTTPRKLEIKLTSVIAGTQKVVVNTANVFEFISLDDESVYGAYELDITNPEQFAKYLRLFGIINEEIKDLSANAVKEINIEFQYGEFKAIVVLKEMEEINECGETEMVNKEIEIEGEFEELEADKLNGDLEFAGTVEQENGSEKEFVYKGSFKIIDGNLELTLQGEYNDEETAEITLSLQK